MAQPIAILERIYGGTFKSVSGRAEIEDLLKAAGPGARGIVFGSRGRRVPRLLVPSDQPVIATEAQARILAEAYIAEVVEPAVGEEVVTTLVREFSTCWIVGYNTKAFVETGAASHALAGGPIIINRFTGNLRIGSSAAPVEEQLDP